MHLHDTARWEHAHTFGTDRPLAGERRTRWVVALTTSMMAIEVIAGLAFGSMALLADGWHMASHAAALGAALFAYSYARRRANDRRYSFGTGKVGALGGFASAIGLAVVAVLVLVECVARLASSVAIQFDQAIAVAAIGLVVNLVSAWLLRADGDHHGHHHHGEHHHGEHHHGEHHHGEHHHGEHHHDHNLRGAYLHVIADALTSLFAIAALTAGKFLGWTWMDPVTGLVGSLLIGRWSLGLLRDTGAVLLDAEVSEERRRAIRSAIEAEADNRIADLHLWRVGPRHLAAIVSVVTDDPREPDHYKRLLARFSDLAHVTVEVHRCVASSARERAA